MLKKVLPLLLLLSPLAGSMAVAATEFSASEIADDIFLVTGPSGNTLVTVDEGSLVLVDGVPAEQAEDYLVFVEDLTGTGTIKALFNTHWHHNQTGLNATLGQRGVDIIAHENTKLWLGTTIRHRGETVVHTPYPAHALPNITTFDHDSYALSDGQIDYGFMLQAHTDGDIYVYFPERNVLFTGGVVRSDSWVPVDLDTNGFVGGLMDGYAKLLAVANDNTLIVPASGPVMSRADLQAQNDMYRAIMDELVALLREAKEPDEVIAANPAEGYHNDWGSPDVFVDQGFRSLWGHLRNSRHVGGAMP